MSGNHNRESHDTIRLLAMECETLLQSLIDNSPETSKKGLFEDYLQRLSTWAAYLGVFARPSQCLDHRLSDAIDIQDLILRSLDSIGISLTSGLSSLLRKEKNVQKFLPPFNSISEQKSICTYKH
jgi:hypothetical protein